MLKEYFIIKGTDVSKNNIGLEAADDMYYIMLPQNNQLQGLYLGDNYLQSEGAVKIARGMKGTSSVELNISNNNICGKAVNGIAAILSCNHNL